MPTAINARRIAKGLTRIGCQKMARKLAAIEMTPRKPATTSADPALGVGSALTAA
jgi:hypothetical protein